MKAEQAKQLAQHALEDLARALKQGRSDVLTRYLATMARFHRYSFGNVCLIFSQKPDATHVAGFNTWKSLGRFVKKGEKGIVIIAPMAIRPKEKPEEDKPSGPILRFRGVCVFDVAQTDGEPLPEPARVDGDPRGHLERLRAAIAARGITLNYENLPSGVEGMSHGGRITVRAGLSPAQEFAVTIHELAHELMHRGEDRPGAATVRETEAEAVAFVVCQSIGLAVGTASSDYIQLYNGHTETLARSLDRIQSTAASIIAALAEAQHAAA